MRKNLQVFAECPLIVTVDSSIYAEPLVSRIAKGQPILKMGKVSPVPERKKCVAQGHRVSGEIRFQTIPFGLARCLSRNSTLSKLEDEFHLQNVKMEGEK